MNIMELGAIGELVGGIAVIATLVYLALQVRQNTSAIRATSAQAFADSINQMNIGAASSDEAAHFVRLIYEDPSALTEDQRTRADFGALAICRTYESALLQVELGTYDPQTTEMIRKQIQRTFALDYFREWWHRRQFDFTDRFVEFVERELGGQ